MSPDAEPRSAAGLAEILPLLRCPATGTPLSLEDGHLAAERDGRRYPLIDGIPFLIAEERSLFDLEIVREQARGSGSAAWGLAGRLRRAVPGALRFLRSLPPTRTRNVAAKHNYQQLGRLLQEMTGRKAQRPRVLVVGGRIVGAGIEELLARPELEIVETDVALGPRTQLLCDAHDLPFADGAFDAVIIQAVLEQVVEPPRVASEIHRVLSDGGLVYSEAPFIQQVHEGAFDFQRFTHLGHRRLWRNFDEISSGAQCGPGMALLWSLQYFLQAFARRRILRGLIARLVSLGAFWLKYFDDFLAKEPGGIDAASGTFFLGRRRDTPLPDREIVRSFRGVKPEGQRLPRRQPQP